MGRPILSPGKKLTGEKTDRYTGPVRLPIYNFSGAFIKRDFFFAICKPLFFFIHLKKKIVFYSMKIDLVLAKSALFGISSGFITFAKVSI